MSEHHIVIGDGLTAAEFATTKICNAGDTLSIIGPNINNLGRGVAYAQAPDNAAWKYAYLLNSPARSVDLAFSDWLNSDWISIEQSMVNRTPDWLLAAQPYVAIGEIASLNAPRELYGDFYHLQTIEKLALLEKSNVRVRRISAMVRDISVNAQQLKVHLDDGSTLAADSIDVATGGPQNQRIAGDNDERSFPELFGHETHIANALDANGTIIAIGASAAMLDLLRFCQSLQAESNLNFTAISPTGRTLEALRPGNTFTPATYELQDTYKRAEDFIDAIKHLQQQALNSGHNFYETRVGLRSLFLDKSVNEFVPNIKEARKVARPLFRHFEGGTRDSIDDFHRLEKSGRTNIIAGHVHKIEQTKAGASVHYTNETGELKQLKANVVVNCAGPGKENRFDALTTKMLEQQWISVCQQSHGLLVGDKGQTSIPGIRYLGPAVTSIGVTAQPVPLYDAFRLRRAVQQFNSR